MAKVLTVTPDIRRGAVRVQGIGVPAGPALVTRQAKGIPDPIRGGDLTVSTGGFILDDSEPPFGTPLLYRVTSTPTNRNIQSNRVLNPKFKNDLTNWTLPAGRATARDTGTPLPPRDAAQSLRVGPLVGGDVVGGLDQRLLAKCSPNGFTTGRWFITGQMRYDSPDIWLWDDAKATTWQGVKNKGTWQQVKDAQSTAAGTAFATFNAAVLNPTSATTVRTNYFRNARAAVAGAFGLASGTGGAGTSSWVQGGGPTTATPNFWRTTWTAATTAPSGGVFAGAVGNAASGYAVPVTAGQAVTISASVRASKAQRAGLLLLFYDASGAQLTASQITGAGTVLVANTWTTLSVSGTIPANAVRMIVAAAAMSGTGGVNWAVNDTIDISRILFEVTANTTAGTFFDGDSVDTVASPTSTFYNWAGAQYQSESTEAATSGVLVVPFQVIGIQASDNGGWVTFQAWVDVPAGAPANCQLAFYQGTLTREYAVTWWMTSFMVTPEVEALSAGIVSPYFDGDSVLPANPAANLAPGYDWFDVSHDASFSWTGTPNASVSVFTGPSIIASQADPLTITAPGKTLLPRNKLPIMLSDPVLPQVNMWFELMKIGDLTFAARQDLYDVIARGPKIAVGSERGWADGELQLMTYTLNDASVAERMFAPGRILFLRNPDPRFPESSWYLAIGDVVSGRVGDAAAWAPERLWRVPFARVERPVGLISAASSVSWQDVKTNYTWDTLRQKREDWLDAAVTPA